MTTHAIIYTFICLTIGYLGRRRKLGFWGYFFGSMLLSPFMGLLLVFASDPIPKNKNNE